MIIAAEIMQVRKTFLAASAVVAVVGAPAQAQQALGEMDLLLTAAPSTLDKGGLELAPSADPTAEDAAARPATIRVSRTADLVGRPLDLRAAIGLKESLGPRSLPSMSPLSNSVLTSRFGNRRHPTLGGWRHHNGVDLASPQGTEIRATADGVVATAQWNGGYGLYVGLKHPGGVETSYGHMSRLNVSAGQNVRRGQVIGFVGSTGRSTGPHLHYEVRVNGRPVAPNIASQ